MAIAWLLAAEMRKAHQRTPFDIIEVPDVDALGLPLLLDAARDVPVVAHLHCCTGIALQANNTPISPEHQLITTLEFSAIRLADGVCAPTQAVVENTRVLFPIDATPSIIPYPFVSPQAPFAPPIHNSPVIFLGRIERLKGCGLLPAALNSFLARNPSATFRFIGPDTSTAQGGRSMRHHILESLSPQIARRVELLGEFPREQNDAQLAACSFCVQPSLSENFSVACCEAMAAGRTIIVGSGTGSVELVGDAGVVVERGSSTHLAEAMDALYNDRPRLIDLSRKAYNRIRSISSPPAVAAQRVEFYRNIIAEFRPTRAIERLQTLPPSIAAALLPALSMLTGSLTGALDSRETKSPGSRLDRICESLSQPANVLLYGAGKHTTRLLAERHTWERHGHRVVGVIDDHPKFVENPSCLGLPVRSLAAAEAAARAGEALPPIVLSTDTYEEQFWERTAALRALDVPVFRLYG